MRRTAMATIVLMIVMINNVAVWLKGQEYAADRTCELLGYRSYEFVGAGAFLCDEDMEAK